MSFYCKDESVQLLLLNHFLQPPFVLPVGIVYSFHICENEHSLLFFPRKSRESGWHLMQIHKSTIFQASLSTISFSLLDWLIFSSFSSNFMLGISLKPSAHCVNVSFGLNRSNKLHFSAPRSKRILTIQSAYRYRVLILFLSVLLFSAMVKRYLYYISCQCLRCP